MTKGGTMNDDEDPHLHFMYSQSNEHVGKRDRWQKFWTIQSQEGSSTNMDVVRAPSSRDDDFDADILISNDPLLEGLRTNVEDDDHYSEYESLTHLHCPQPIKPTDVVVTIQVSLLTNISWSTKEPNLTDIYNSLIERLLQSLQSKEHLRKKSTLGFLLICRLGMQLLEL